MVRLFVEQRLHAGADIAANEGQAHYVVHVMRLLTGSQVALFNGRDGEWHARITMLGRSRVGFEVAEQVRPQEPEPDLWLVFAPLKRDPTDLVMRQATELGVSVLIPVTTTYTNAARINLDRARSIAIEAAEQCGRLSLPEIRPLAKLADLLVSWPAGRRLAAAIERGGAVPVPTATALLIGPEGGFSPPEIDALRRLSFVSPISLGPHVLRAETAAAAGLALLQGVGWSTN